MCSAVEIDKETNKHALSILGCCAVQYIDEVCRREARRCYVNWACNVGNVFIAHSFIYTVLIYLVIFSSLILVDK
jgi:hypothetical protein